MIKRYESKEIKAIWSDEHKLNLWQKTELAVIEAMVSFGGIDKLDYEEIYSTLTENSIDIDWWLSRDKEIRHDLQAFLDERLRFLPPRLQIYLHKDITSYDTEEPAFAQMIKESLSVVKKRFQDLEKTITDMALKYRYTVMNARTHGQEAVLQTFGKRCLTWLVALRMDFDNLRKSEENLRYSKLSGAVGNYGFMDPLLEEDALKILGFKPFYGATQIIPREVYAPIAQAISQLVATLNKIAIDVRLGARSGNPIYQEPFSKKQKGSSIMPHKKNTISTEQIKGMSRMAGRYYGMIEDNIETWEERAIEQSCVERVAWPDLFHVAAHSLKTMNRVLKGLRIYPDNMLQEVVNSRGCYASGVAKEVLKELGLSYGLSSEGVYRVVQLAAFNAFEVGKKEKKLRDNPPKSLTEADKLLKRFQRVPRQKSISIQEIIAKGILNVSEDLEATEEDVEKWNRVLRKIFSEPENLSHWNEIFLPSYLVEKESELYEQILGI